MSTELNASENGRIFVFASEGCLFSKRTKQLLADKSVPFYVIDCQRFPDLWEIVVGTTGATTVPQIFLNYRQIWGWKELAELEEQDELDDLLAQTFAEPAPVDFPPRLEEMILAASFHSTWEGQHRSVSSSNSDSSSIVEDPFSDGIDVNLSDVSPFPNFAAASMRLSSSQENLSTPGLSEEETDEYESILRRLKDPETGVQIANRFYHLRRYRNCFIGSELVDWLMEHMEFENRSDAVEFGQALLDQGMFHHVCNEHPLRDGYFFYRFQEDEPSNVLNMKRIFHGVSRPANEVAEDLRDQMMNMKALYMNDDGTGVNYSALSRSEEFRAFQNTAVELQVLRLDLLAEGERRAFFVNLYNTLVIHGFVEIGVPNGSFQRSKFFSKTAYRIDKYDYSLNDIEHGILRGNKKPPYSFRKPFRSSDPRREFVLPLDARIHFALVCGAKSCPPIKVYTSSKLDRQLGMSARSFVRSEIEVDSERKRITCSKIIAWYRSDFGQNDLEAIRFLMQFMSEEQIELIEKIELSNFSVRYRPYDWSVNEQ